MTSIRLETLWEVKRALLRRHEVMEQHGYNRPNPPTTPEAGFLEAIEFALYDVDKMLGSEYVLPESRKGSI